MIHVCMKNFMPIGLVVSVKAKHTNKQIHFRIHNISRDQQTSVFNQISSQKFVYDRERSNLPTELACKLTLPRCHKML